MGVGPFELRIDEESRKAVWKKVRRRGGRKQEWNNPNRKMSAKIAKRQSAFEKGMTMCTKMKDAPAGALHRPGSHKKT